MKLFAIYGQDGMYQGSHGMIETKLCEAESVREALSFAKELSYHVIDSYADICDNLEEEWRDACDFDNIEDLDSDAAQELREEIFSQDLDYGCCELDKEKLPTLNEEELEQMLYNDFEDFIREYQKCED